MGQLRIEDIPHYTIDDYLLWEGRWELINGLPYAMTPAPVIEHQRISQKILSKSSAKKDTVTKYHLYEKEGVKYYVMIDPFKKRAKVYENVQRKFIKNIDAAVEYVEFKLMNYTIFIDFKRVFT